MALRKRLFEHVPELGQTKWWYYDDATDEAYIETVYDHDAYGASSVEQRKLNDGTRFGDLAHIAQIPMALYWKLKARGVFDDQRAFRRWFQSDEAAPFKVRDLWLGRVNRGA